MTTTTVTRPRRNKPVGPDVARWDRTVLSCRTNQHAFLAWDVVYVRGEFFYRAVAACARGCGVIATRDVAADGTPLSRALDYTGAPSYLAKGGRPDRCEIRAAYFQAATNRSVATSDDLGS